MILISKSLARFLAFSLITGACGASASSPTLAPASVGDVREIDFADPVLSKLQERAAASHPSIFAAEASLRSAGVGLRGARWQRFPSVSVESQVMSDDPGLDRFQAVIEQPLWTGGAINSLIRGAGHRQVAAMARYDEAVQQILIAVSQAYFDLYRWRSRGLIFTESLRQHRLMVEAMERRVRQDISPLSDLELVRSRSVQIEHQLTQSTAQAEKALRRLRELLNDPTYLDSGEIKHLRVWPSFTEVDALQNGLEFSPRLRALRAEALALRSDASIARAQTLPRVAAQYRYGDKMGHRFGIVLKAQLSGGLSGFAAAESASLRAEEAQFQIDSAERDLREQLVSDLQDYTFNRDRLDNSRAAAESAKRVMESYMRQFTSGRRTWLDVMNAVREANSADIDALEAEVVAYSALQRILLTTGRLRLVSDEVGS